MTNDKCSILNFQFIVHWTLGIFHWSLLGRRSGSQRVGGRAKICGARGGGWLLRAGTARGPVWLAFNDQ